MVFNKALDKYSSSLPSRHMIQLHFPSPKRGMAKQLAVAKTSDWGQAHFATSLLPWQHPATLLMVKALQLHQPSMSRINLCRFLSLRFGDLCYCSTNSSWLIQETTICFLPLSWPQIQDPITYCFLPLTAKRSVWWHLLSKNVSLNSVPKPIFFRN